MTKESFRVGSASRGVFWELGEEKGGIDPRSVTGKNLCFKHQGEGGYTPTTSQRAPKKIRPTATLIRGDQGGVGLPLKLERGRHYAVTRAAGG